MIRRNPMTLHLQQQWRYDGATQQAAPPPPAKDSQPPAPTSKAA